MVASVTIKSNCRYSGNLDVIAVVATFVVLNLALSLFGCRVNREEIQVLTSDVFTGEHVRSGFRQAQGSQKTIACRHYGDDSYVLSRGEFVAVATNYYPAKFVISSTSDWVRVWLFPVFPHTKNFSTAIILSEAKARNINGMPVFRYILTKDDNTDNYIGQISKTEHALFRGLLALLMAQFQSNDANAILVDYYYGSITTANSLSPDEQVIIAIRKLFNAETGATKPDLHGKVPIVQLKDIEHIDKNRIIARVDVMLDGYTLNRHTVVCECRIFNSVPFWMPVSDDIYRH